jgi:6-phospho-beta-glucosidase
MKIAVVGGGSTYTPELVDGVARLGVPVEELALIDPATERLEIVGAFAARIFDHYGAPGAVTWTSDLARGLDGASAVLLQLRVGGQQARISDETFPLELGCIGQETTGAGGLAKAMRTVPVVLSIAEEARKRCEPGAWIIDFTNPVGIVTRALLDAGHRAVGLCNVAIGLQRRAAGFLGVDPDAVELNHVGLNHLTWELGVSVGGRDVLPEMLAGHLDELAADLDLPPALLAAQAAIPSYYLRYFYLHDEEVQAQRNGPTRGETVAALETELLRLYADPALVEKPPQLASRGGAFYSEAAVGLLASLNGTPGVHSVNVRNNGTLPFLPDNAVVEVTAPVTVDGPAPLPRDVPAQLRGLIAHVSAYEELAVAAAVHGGRRRIYDALLAHPLIGQHALAEGLTDRLLAANTSWVRP